MSHFTKDNLPTWQELYDTWQSKQFTFDPELDTEGYEMDPYWNLPVPECRIVMLSNWLNYIILKRGMEEVTKDLEASIHDIDSENEDEEMHQVVSIRFGVMTEDDLADDTAFCHAMESEPDLPVRFLIKGVSDKFCSLVAYATIQCDSAIYVNGYLTDKTDAIERIVGILLKEVINYFENGVGWKDSDGNLIPSERAILPCSSGADPAL